MLNNVKITVKMLMAVLEFIKIKIQSLVMTKAAKATRNKLKILTMINKTPITIS